MPIRLVALDLDGTLLDAAKAVPQTAADAVADALEAGVAVVLATARAPRSTLPFHRRLGLRGAMICYNGALVLDPGTGRRLLHLPIAAGVARDVAYLVRRLYPRALVSAEVLDRWYTDRVDPKYLNETTKLGGPDVLAPMARWINQPVTKLLVLGEPGGLAPVAGAVRARFATEVRIIQTEDEMLQISHAAASKGKALRAVAGELGCEADEVLALGDNANDVGMLRWAGTGVAVGNASAEALAAADCAVAASDAGGVAEAIRRFVLGGQT